MNVTKHRILQVSNNHFVAGGSDRYYLELSSALRSGGHDVLNFAAKDARNQSSPWQDYFPDAPLIENASPGDFGRYLYSRAARRELRRLLQQEQVDVAHLHIYYGRLTGSIFAPFKEREIPVVQTLHEYKLICAVYTCMRDGQTCEDCNGRAFWKAARYRCNRGSVTRSVASSLESYVGKSLGSHDGVDHFITVSDFQRGRLLANEICAPEKVTTVHNFVDPDVLQPEAEPGRYVLYFGRLEKLKGLDTLLDAMSRIPDVKLKIVGDGSYSDACAQKITSLALNNVELCGFQSGDTLLSTLRGASCTVIPSEWYENCPMSVLESLALAKPVVGTDIGGIPELVDDGNDGLVVPVADAHALANALEMLAKDSARCRQMGEAGRRKIQQRFSPAVHVAQIQSVYDSVQGR